MKRDYKQAVCIGPGFYRVTKGLHVAKVEAFSKREAHRKAEACWRQVARVVAGTACAPEKPAGGLPSVTAKPSRGVPDLRFDLYFVPHGNQVDVFLHGKEVTSGCRDFSGSYPVKELHEKFYRAIADAITATEDKL